LRGLTRASIDVEFFGEKSDVWGRVTKPGHDDKQIVVMRESPGTVSFSHNFGRSGLSNSYSNISRNRGPGISTWSLSSRHSTSQIPRPATSNQKKTPTCGWRAASCAPCVLRRCGCSGLRSRMSFVIFGVLFPRCARSDAARDFTVRRARYLARLWEESDGLLVFPSAVGPFSPRS